MVFDLHVSISSLKEHKQKQQGKRFQDFRTSMGAFVQE
jgi:hypothetical protein